MLEEEAIKRKFEMSDTDFNERTRRHAAAAEAMALGWGGISAVSRATGISQVTIRKGIKELNSVDALSQGSIRQVGGGRKKTVSKDASLIVDLEQLMEPVTNGYREPLLRWTCKSVRQLTAELQDHGQQVSYPVVCELLREMGYSLQAYRKVRERGDYSGRDCLFADLNEQANYFISQYKPVISIEIMKKDVLSDETNSEEFWQLPTQASADYSDDYRCAETAFITPYIMFEPAQDTSWKKIRIDQNTVTFVVESLRQWWKEVGKSKYHRPRRLLIGTPGVGLHESHSLLWQWELQRLADETQLKIRSCELPEGTSKWCKFEDRLFAWIKQIKQGRSLTSYAIILRDITVTTPNSEPIVQCHLDTNPYHAIRKISNEEAASIRLETGIFPNDWNYDIYPHDTSY